MKISHSAITLVFNTNSKLLLQLRSSTDPKYPLHWDFSAAGAVDPGETNIEAAKRELFEEIGVTTTLTYLKKLPFTNPNSIDYLHIFYAQHNGPFDCNPKEVAKVEFFQVKEIEAMINSGLMFHPEFIYVWNLNLIQKL